MLESLLLDLPMLESLMLKSLNVLTDHILTDHTFRLSSCTVKLSSKHLETRLKAEKDSEGEVALVNT